MQDLITETNKETYHDKAYKNKSYHGWAYHRTLAALPRWISTARSKLLRHQWNFCGISFPSEFLFPFFLMVADGFFEDICTGYRDNSGFLRGNLGTEKSTPDNTALNRKT